MSKPFKAIKKVGSGYKVVDKNSGKTKFSKKPQSKAKALSQLRAIEFHKHNPGAK
jgi:hypothetical protein